MALADYRALVTDRLRDTVNLIAVEAKNAAIQEAVTRYARARPRQRVQILTGDGATFTFALAADFEDGFSDVLGIEHPVDKQEPEYIDRNEFRLYRDSAGVMKLRLLDLIMADTKTAYVTYTARHTVDDATPTPADTVPLTDRAAVASLATAICLRQLAAHYAQTKDPTMGADVVSYRTKSQEYLDLAKALERAYREHLGLSDDGPAAASAIKDLDVDLQSGVGDRFFHGRRYR